MPSKHGATMMKHTRWNKTNGDKEDIMEQIAVSMILVSVFVLGVCLFHGVGVAIMRLWNQRTGKRELHVVRRMQ